MNRLIATIVLGMAVAALAACATNNAGWNSAAGDRTLDPKTGAFHRVHVTDQKMACKDCHATETKDPLFLRTAEVAKTSQGPVDRKECLACHQAPDKPTWYGAVK